MYILCRTERTPLVPSDSSTPVAPIFNKRSREFPQFRSIKEIIAEYIIPAAYLPMSFLNEKDFRKGAGSAPPPKRAAIISGRNVKGDDTKKTDNVVERAKLERVERARVRETTMFVIKIQSWWRGRSTAFKTISALRTSFDSKLNDIENLTSILLSKNNIVFVPPIQICMELAAKLTAFGLHVIEVRLTRFI